MSAVSDRFKVSKRFMPTQKNVWAEYKELEATYNPLNLGMGFSDSPPPNFITDTLVQVARSDNCLLHQYTRDYGHPRLVNVLSKLYSKLVNRQIDPHNEILVTIGAEEALFSIIFGHVDVKDEVIIVEPFYDSYETLVKAVGGVAKFIPLRLKNGGNVQCPSDWMLDRDELESVFSSKTKIFILNNPHNPVGKVFKREELEVIAQLCAKWNVLCISDEVYEWVVYKPNKHIRMATLPGMWDRTLTIGSAGKTFSVTGWKIGWVYGPSKRLHNVRMVHQNSVYTGNTPMQEVLAIAFEKELKRLDLDDCYFNSLTSELMIKRDFMCNFLIEVGMKPIVPEGGYFMIADWTSLEADVDLSSEGDSWKDYRFTKWMVKNIGLQGLPPSAFFSEKNKPLGENFVRYCFFKKIENLEKAAQILKQWRLKK